MTTEATPICRWCDRPFAPRQHGGHDQRFCRPTCRRAFHAAARSWALSELAAGRLTVAHVKKGLPATRTLAGEGKSPASVPEEGKAIDLLDDILHELLSDTSPNSLDALSIDTLDRISAYLDEPLP